jgi:hypothetical protein
MAKFAKGKYALAISDRSGQAFPWREMVTEWNGAFVHLSEYEPKQPQLEPKPFVADPQGLEQARPQRFPSDQIGGGNMVANLTLPGDFAFQDLSNNSMITSFMSEFNNLNSQGVPKYYSNWDQDTVVVAPTPDATYTIQLNYILKPDGLSSTVPTTYLSLQFPNGLLYACLTEAFSFLKGPNDLLQLYEGKYKQVVEGFSIEQMGRRRRDEYQSGVPRIGK